MLNFNFGRLSSWSFFLMKYEALCCFMHTTFWLSTHRREGGCEVWMGSMNVCFLCGRKGGRINRKVNSESESLFSLNNKLGCRMLLACSSFLHLWILVKWIATHLVNRFILSCLSGSIRSWQDAFYNDCTLHIRSWLGGGQRRENSTHH